MPSVQLDDEEWQRVLAIVAQAPWNVANPLLLKIGDQLRRQSEKTSLNSGIAGSSPDQTSESKHN